jgi:FtsH-binding integral membrane protein
LEQHWFATFLIPLIIVASQSLIAFFARSVLSKTPINWISYLLFTIGFATLFAHLSVTYKETGTRGGYPVVLQDGTWIYFYVLCMASMISFALSVHTLTTKSELTFQSASLYVVGSVLLVAFLFLVFSDMKLILSHILTFAGIIWGFYIVWENESVVSGT